MIEVLLQMGALIICGIVWRRVRPGKLEPMATRKVLTSLVYYLLLPALVLSVLWRADLGTGSLMIAGAAAVAVVIGMLVSLLICRACKTGSAQAGALILAATFPNATYLGLPVLEATFGPWARSIAIQYDLFACTPLLFTLGIWVAARLGTGDSSEPRGFAALLRIPALWAAMAAITLNVLAVPMPEVIKGFLQLLERGVVPLMLFSLGLSLEWRQSGWRVLPMVAPVVLIRMFVVPALVLAGLVMLGADMSGEVRAAIIMESAMPCMVLGLVICDQFNLDTALYAVAVTVTTALSLVTLPLWYGWLMT